MKFTGTIIIILAIACFIALIVGSFFIGSASFQTRAYALTTVIFRISEGNDTVTAIDYNGNLWTFQGVEDWAVGDVASLLMDSRGTDKISDDIIIKATYNGFIEGHWGRQIFSPLWARKSPGHS